MSSSFASLSIPEHREWATPKLLGMALRLRWLRPIIAITPGSIPEGGLLVENPEKNTVRWTGAELCAICSLQTHTGRTIIGSGHPLGISAVAKGYSMYPGECRPVPLALRQIKDDDLRQLEAGRYKVVIDRCMIPSPMELPEPLHLTVPPSGE